MFIEYFASRGALMLFFAISRNINNDRIVVETTNAQSVYRTSDLFGNANVSLTSSHIDVYDNSSDT